MENFNPFNRNFLNLNLKEDVGPVIIYEVKKCFEQNLIKFIKSLPSVAILRFLIIISGVKMMLQAINCKIFSIKTECETIMW